MSNINGQFTPVLQQSAGQQILSNDKLKTQQQQVILQQVSFYALRSVHNNINFLSAF